MKIFVCEYITSGGLCREALSQALAIEGLMMRDALLRDLAEIPSLEVICAYDARLSAPAAKQAISIAHTDDVWQRWQNLIQQSDAVWLIAPEADGVLLRLTELATAQGKQILGCPPSAVKKTSSKLETYRVLALAGISVIPTCAAKDWLSISTLDKPENGWVIKPDDGVSCEDTVHIIKLNDVIVWLNQGRASTHIVQPYQMGEPASLSMLCLDGRAWLLSCNRQKIVEQDSCFSYQGSVINGLTQHRESFEALAQQIAQAMPDLTGYIGVDLLVQNAGLMQAQVLEVNPRLTTSYVGLTEATGVNIAQLVLNLLDKKMQKTTPFSLPKIGNKIIEVTL